jgi:hypothetical protein
MNEGRSMGNARPLAEFINLVWFKLILPH